MIQHKTNNNQIGQTLIETIAAIFILTTALTGGLALTIYVLSNSNTSQDQIVATQLAREGTEVFRMMRDSNWLAGDVSSNTSYNLASCSDISGQSCYPQAFIGPSYNIANSGSGGNFRINFNTSSRVWSLNGASDYSLYLQSDGSYESSPVVGTAKYFRKINVTLNSAAPFSANNPELIVKSTVGWTGKHCSAMTGTDPSTTNCNVVVEDHLTNWKDYK